MEILSRRKLFARRDYAGLDAIAAKSLRERRSKLAKKLSKRKAWNNAFTGSSPESISERNAIHSKISGKINSKADKARNILLKDSRKRFRKKAKERLINYRKSKDPFYTAKKVGKGVLGASVLAGIGYGGKKLYDRYKNNNK